MTIYTPPPEPGRTASRRNRPVPLVIGILLALVPAVFGLWGNASFSKVVPGSSIESWTEIEAARWATASTPAVQRRQEAASRTSPTSNGRNPG